MKKAEKEELDELFRSVIKLFKSRCWICREPLTADDAWVIHHWEYKTGEKNYDDFRFPNGTKDRLNYYRYLIPIVRKEPHRFRMMHNLHHFVAEVRWAVYKPENFKRMVKLARQINKRKYHY